MIVVSKVGAFQPYLLMQESHALVARDHHSHIVQIIVMTEGNPKGGARMMPSVMFRSSPKSCLGNESQSSASK
jgi:hypothetical protein